MKCDLIVGVQIHSLDDVEFALIGPVRTNHPEGWPGAAVAPWNMRKVRDHESVRIRCLARDSHAVPADAVGVESRGGVDAHVDLVVRCLE